MHQITESVECANLLVNILYSSVEDSGESMRLHSLV